MPLTEKGKKIIASMNWTKYICKFFRIPDLRDEVAVLRFLCDGHTRDIKKLKKEIRNLKAKIRRREAKLNEIEEVLNWDETGKLFCEPGHDPIGPRCQICLGRERGIKAYRKILTSVLS